MDIRIKYSVICGELFAINRQLLFEAVVVRSPLLSYPVLIVLYYTNPLRGTQWSLVCSV